MPTYTVYAQYSEGTLVNFDVVSNSPIVVYSLQAPGVGTLRLRDLQDVVTTTPSNGQVLTYSTAGGTWGPGSLAGGGDMLAATYDSDANSAIDMAAGGLNTDVSAFDGMLKIAGGTASALKYNFGGTTAPTVNEDTGDGYAVGSLWLDTTNDKAYICLDATLAAAVWTEVTAQDLAASATMARVPGSTYSTIQHMQDIFHSAGLTTGGGITDDTDGTITVAAGSGLIRATNSDLAPLLWTDWPAESGANVALVDNDMNYVYVEYNSGSPQVVASITERTDTNTNIFLGSVYRIGTTLHITSGTRPIVGDHALKMIQRMIATMPFQRESGAVLSGSGTRNINLTTGVFWEGLQRFTTAALDTSVTGSFTYAYRDGIGGWTYQASQTQINNTQYDDGSGTLATLTSSRYSTHWVYVEDDSDVYVVFGRGDYTLAQAQEAGPPADVPPHMAESHARLIGKIIIQKSASSFTDVVSAFDTVFTPSAATDHGDLIGLADDDHTQYSLADGTRWTTTPNSNVLPRVDGSGNLIASDINFNGTQLDLNNNNLFVRDIAQGGYILVGPSVGSSMSLSYIAASNAASITSNGSTLAVNGVNGLTLQSSGGTVFSWPSTDGSSGHVLKTDGAGTLALADVNGLVSAASDTVSGKVELATTAETSTGTDTARAVTPDGLAGSVFGTQKMVMKFLADGATLATGSFKFPIPRSLAGFNVVFCDIYLEDSGSSGTNSFMLHNATDVADVLTGNITLASGGGGWATTGTINTATDDAAALDMWQLDIDTAATGATGPAFIVLEFKLP